ncbi:agmatinase [Planctomycetales bacterium]|nr:agmatinase [Planctomycetales bacterium]GHT05629.1 agmatinase [Planctomycetales bacterium]GHV22153.1 agmatinase [Planctomycetales bacterium]
MATAFLGASDVTLDQAVFSVIPAPSEAGATYLTGQKNAPQAIIDASAHLESFDEEFGRDLLALDAVHTVDPASAPSDSALSNWLVEQVNAALAAVAVPVVLGGDGTVSYPAIKAIADRAHDERQELSVLHIDAHADLNELDAGENNLNVMRSVLALKTKNIHLSELGVRSLSRAAFDLISDDENGVDCFFTSDLRNASDEHWQDDVVKELSSPVYVSIDLSALATGLVPNVGNPEPGGFTWLQLTGLLRRLATRRRIAGIDIVELCPHPNLPTSDYTVARLVYKLMNAIVAGGKVLAKS